MRYVLIASMLLAASVFHCGPAMASTTPAKGQAKGELTEGSTKSQTPLMRAIRDTDNKTFQALLSQTDLNETDDQGWTALMMAAYVGEPSFVKALLKKGANVNAKNKAGLTALFLATNSLVWDPSRETDIAKLLIERGADVNTKNESGVTPLMIAARRGSLKVVKLLLEKGAKINDENSEHETALTYALDSSSKYAKEVVEYLRSAGATGPEPKPHSNPLVSRIDQRPVALNSPAPSYTERARQNKVEGIIVARVLVGEDGTVQQVRITKGLPDGLNEQAIRAAYALKFKPAMKEGKPVKFWQAVQIEFHLRR